MRVLLFLFLSVALLCTVAFGDHDNKPHKKHSHKDDHQKKHDHKDDHKKGGHHPHRHHHHSNESLPCHKIAYSNSRFAFELFRQIASDHPSENIVFSPVSISTAFAFLSLGAKSKTHDQIIEGLRFNTSKISEREIHEGFHHLLELLNDPDSELQLSSGNALFIDKEHKLLPTFLSDAKKFYHSESFSSDFKNSEKTKKQINSYVGKQTHGKIPELLSSVDQDALLVLINYIYFRGKWEQPFDEKWTKEGDFHVNENTTVKVPFMTRTGMYHVSISEDATVVSIPYKGNASALFVLPKEGKFKQVEQNFNKEAVMKWKKSMHRELVDLTIPKFSISGTVNLKETLSKLGVVDVFSNNADLSGITGEPNVKISKAVHKAVLSVDEKGTEAAGSTALEAVPMMLPPRVLYDQPFLISMWDSITKSVLFYARVVNPAN